VGGRMSGVGGRIGRAISMLAQSGLCHPYTNGITAHSLSRSAMFVSVTMFVFEESYKQRLLVP